MRAKSSDGLGDSGMLFQAALGKIAPGPGKMIAEIVIGERIDPDSLVFSGGMDEFSIPGVNPHMRDFVSALAQEKNQISPIEIIL